MAYVPEGIDVDGELKRRHWAKKSQERPGGDFLECGLSEEQEQRRQQEQELRRQDEQEKTEQPEQKERRQEQKEQQRQAGQVQNTGLEQSKQGKQVRYGGEEQLGETFAESTDEPEVTDGLAEVRTGRGSAGLVRGRDERCQTDETRKGKGKGNGGKGEHGSKGGAGSKGTQQVENSVTDEDQENMGAMRSEEEEEDHREDVKKLVEMMQKEEEQEEQRGRVAPNVGAGGSHLQAMSVPERRETRGMRWADCENDERQEEEEREQETEKETRQESRQEELTSEKPPGLKQKDRTQKERKHEG